VCAGAQCVCARACAQRVCLCVRRVCVCVCVRQCLCEGSARCRWGLGVVSDGGEAKFD
jgi:hypothetical protein